VHPSGGLGELTGREPEHHAPTVALAAHETGLLQQRQVLHHGLAGHGESVGDLPGTGRRAAEPLEDSTSGRAELTAQHTGQTVDRILSDGDCDRWFTPQEALDYGMIDQIIERPTPGVAC
jgi:ATP-dependent protease ClpP protease subunit